MSKVKIGDVFGRLTVIKELEKRSSGGYIRYECKCSCGNVVEVNSRELLNGDTISCNCYRKEQVKKRYYDATLPDRILSDNINKNNTSGIKGVYFYKNRNKWIARFQWQGKQHFLGSFNTISEAENARKIFENEIRKKYL